MLEEVRKLIHGQSHCSIPTDDILPEMSLEEDLGLDSLDVTELKMQAEMEFKIKIPDGSVNDALTVGDLVDIVREHL